ncbi:MAG: class I SAM-dependent methyltransferase [Armatimonadetes bacterium]|nr:class I SAM-dependent methyltransferase [Armatimonadota bacterium]
MNLDLAKLAHLPRPDSPSQTWQRAEGLEIERVRAIDRVVGDLAAYLDVPRGRVFELAQAHAAEAAPGTEAALCHEVLDLLDERERFHVLCDLFMQSTVSGLLDYGHGSAAATLPFAHLASATIVVAEAGPALDFAAWRMARHGLAHGLTLTTAQAVTLPADTFTLVVCLLAQPDPERALGLLDRCLVPGGMIMLGDAWEPYRVVLRGGGYRPLHAGDKTTVHIKPR